MAAHRPKPSRTSIDLINRFLKAQPRIKTPTAENRPVEEQADLSVRSTQAAPALASESLAKIMVKQGKVDKAIEIYERLMQRQPEKMAYFADQIQQLKQPSA
jgi:pentatricopeptide repeat protein